MLRVAYLIAENIVVHVVGLGTLLNKDECLNKSSHSFATVSQFTDNLDNQSAIYSLKAINLMYFGSALSKVQRHDTLMNFSLAFSNACALARLLHTSMNKAGIRIIEAVNII